MSYQVRPYKGPFQPMPRTDLGDEPHTHGSKPRPIFSSTGATSSILNSLLSEQAIKSRTVYLVLWRGPLRVPRGAIVAGWTIQSTQHGLVTATLPGSTKPTRIGTYSRIQDGNGPNRDLNEMLVYIDQGFE